MKMKPKECSMFKPHECPAHYKEVAKNYLEWFCSDACPIVQLWKALDTYHEDIEEAREDIKTLKGRLDELQRRWETTEREVWGVGPDEKMFGGTTAWEEIRKLKAEVEELKKKPKRYYDIP